MLVLGLDEETTGLDPNKDQIIEIGAVLWDTARKTPLQMYSKLIQADDLISSQITEITGITNQDLIQHGAHDRKGVLEDIIFLSEQAEYIVAHNAPFDRAFLEKEIKEHCGAIFDHDWIDTRVDVPWRTNGSRKLSYLCADHGFVNPFAHRALFDVLSMLKAIDSYDFNEILERSKWPIKRLIAGVDYHSKDLAKEQGFYWNGNKKEWFMDIKECDMKEIISRCHFEIQIEEIL